MDELIIASNNNHKIEEIKAILKPYNIKAYSLAEIGIDIDVVEDGFTFKENAFKKAQAIYDIVKKPVLSDDSGLEVEALDNEPGINSARYANDHDDEANLNKVLHLMINQSNKKARYVCGIALILDDNKSYYVEGYLDGTIANEKQGENGFGYDPIFYLEEYQASVAQLDKDIKNKISHRANALNELEIIIKEQILCQ